MNYTKTSGLDNSRQTAETPTGTFFNILCCTGQLFKSLNLNQKVKFN